MATFAAAMAAAWYYHALAVNVRMNSHPPFLWVHFVVTFVMIMLAVYVGASD
jgi:hypothetical protein